MKKLFICFILIVAFTTAFVGGCIKSPTESPSSGSSCLQNDSSSDREETSSSREENSSSQYGGLNNGGNYNKKQ